MTVYIQHHVYTGHLHSDFQIILHKEDLKIVIPVYMSGYHSLYSFFALSLYYILLSVYTFLILSVFICLSNVNHSWPCLTLYMHIQHKDAINRL